MCPEVFQATAEADNLWGSERSLLHMTPLSIGYHRSQWRATDYDNLLIGTCASANSLTIGQESVSVFGHRIVHGTGALPKDFQLMSDRSARTSFLESLSDDSSGVDSSHAVRKPRFSAPCREKNSSVLPPLPHGHSRRIQGHEQRAYSGRVLRLAAVAAD